MMVNNGEGEEVARVSGNGMRRQTITTGTQLIVRLNRVEKQGAFTVRIHDVGEAFSARQENARPSIPTVRFFFRRYRRMITGRRSAT